VNIAAVPVSRTITVRGSLDLATAPELCTEIAHLAAVEAEPIVVDLRSVDFSDSTGLRALVGATREAAIRSCQLLVAVDPGSNLDRLLTLTGTREFLHITSLPAHTADQAGAMAT
jgi:anti-sigma B factor antagonist